MFKPFHITFLAFLMSCQIAAQIEENHFARLTPKEAQYIKTYFLDSLDRFEVNRFELSNKKILFITGSAASTLGSKEQYLQSIQDYAERGAKISTMIIELTEEECQKYNYDFIITYWTKMQPNPKRLYRKFKKN